MELKGQRWVYSIFTHFLFYARSGRFLFYNLLFTITVMRGEGVDTSIGAIRETETEKLRAD